VFRTSVCSVSRKVASRFVVGDTAVLDSRPGER
jgi:hypothetical protein